MFYYYISILLKFLKTGIEAASLDGGAVVGSEDRKEGSPNSART